MGTMMIVEGPALRFVRIVKINSDCTLIPIKINFTYFRPIYRKGWL